MSHLREVSAGRARTGANSKTRRKTRLACVRIARATEQQRPGTRAERVGAAEHGLDAPWWPSFLRAAVLLSDAGAVDCGLEYLLRCLFFGITLVAGVCAGRLLSFFFLFFPGRACFRPAARSWHGNHLFTEYRARETTAATSGWCLAARQCEDGGWRMEHGAWSMSMTRSPRRFPLARTLFGGDLPGTGLRSSLLATDKTKRAAPSHLTSSAVRGYCDGPEFCDFRDFAVAQLDVRRPRPWH